MPEKELSILLIEDNPDHADLFQANLELTAYRDARVVHHRTLESGLVALRADSFDLLFIDLSLRDSTISETLDQLSSLNASCPVIVLTSLDDEQTILNVIRKGADDCLPKSELTDILLKRLIQFNLDRWQLKQQLVESREAYRDLYHHSPNMLGSVDARTRRVLNCNQTFADTLGYTREEIINRKITDFYHPDCHEAFNQVFSWFLDKGAVNNEELQLRRCDGTIIDVLLNVSAVRDNEGRIIHTRSTWIDITEKKAAESQLHYMQQLNRLIIETIPDLLWLKDIEGVYLACNPRVEQFLGIMESEIVGKTDYDFIEKEQAKRFHERDQQAIIAGMAVAHEEWATFAIDNAKVLLETIRTPLLYENGMVAGVLGVGRDITERYEAAEKAEAASRAKSAFLSNITHELRTPLNAILGYTQILLRDGTLTDKQQSGIKTIHRAGEHLLLLINDILNISKIESGKLEVVEAEVHPLSFLHDIKDIIELRTKEKGLDFRYAVVGEVPTSILVDGLRLRQVLLNLLSNAVKFTECGYCRLLVRGESTGNDKVLLTFEVEDSGSGIALEDQKIIFEPFRQVGERLHHSEGTGLGLSISSQLVHLMGGGDLQLISPREKKPTGCEGPGSRFFFTLEVPVLHNATLSNSDPRQQIVTSYTSLEESGRKQQVLVIDETPSNRAVLRDILQAVGFVVHEVKDGEKIVESCRAVQPDILLMDLPIPAKEVLLTGLQIKQHKNLAHIPIIALSALVTEERGLRQQCLDHGFSDVVGKPYSARKLFEIMAVHLPIRLTYDGKKEPAIVDDCIMPLSKVLDELVTLVEIGDINGISKKIKEICEMDSGRYFVFCGHLRKYFDEFQFTGLLNFIAANRSRELCNPNKTQYL
ncbi:PAS domain S-box-containing protein [Candidatus Electrothrix aarhusensis]|jgi:PAS domain S-box-containing protein|uniref:histidine kinase n=1 Tax=Candidatus Electrothrix aarhusensis TaxID=1859131 RepID=A0A3S3R8W0_9BACT|nr:PAS domain S-box-containing protein [Candidatus Electrothrix aarhusensis]